MNDKPTIEELIEDSSLGRSAWCGVCGQPRPLHSMSHERRLIIGTAHHSFRPMTHEEWLQRKKRL